jgi:hypothetical protein
MPAREYVNVLGKFIGVREYKDRFEKSVFKPAFKVVAIQSHNRDSRGR